MALAIKAIPTLYGEEAREFSAKAEEAERQYAKRHRQESCNDPEIIAAREMWANMIRED